MKYQVIKVREKFQLLTKLTLIDIVLHFSLFQDAFASARTKKTVGHEAILFSLAEFDIENR
jgi:hypothetical protein